MRRCFLTTLAVPVLLLVTGAFARPTEYAWRPFQPVTRPATPVVRRFAVRNAIDAVVFARGQTPAPPASKHVLLRRVYLDLIGLPPTPAALRALLSDESPDAYERVVDRLLASPQYGERWARHWMDVWRYSDWDGYGTEVRNSQPHLWRWRDWIVSSLNADQGYGRMVQEMLAGDELAPDDPTVLPATGYLARNWYRFNREITLNNLVEHTAKAFLGATVNCARCHDHMFDKISMAEYYAFRAIFATHDVRLDRVPGQPDAKLDGIARVFDGKPSEATFMFVRGDERYPDKTKSFAPGVPALLGGAALQVEPVTLPLTAHTPDRRAFVIREVTTASEQAVAASLAELANCTTNEARALATLKLATAEAKHAALLAVLTAEQAEGNAKVAAEAASLQHKANHLAAQLQVMQTKRALAAEKSPTDATKKKVADAERALTEAEQQLAAPPNSKYQPRVTTNYPKTSSGRRLALARWITDASNPLTARVAVNHIWLRHFGAALVPSVFDFGKNGRPPEQPELLDWLAAEFMDSGWSMKHLHRLIVTSELYRQASTADSLRPAALRFHARRVEAETVRDCVLHAAGELDQRMGGPELDQHQAEKSKRRSLYYRHSMEKTADFLTAFDQANVNECYERAESIMPQQALALANSALALGASRALAAQLTRAGGDFLELAFDQVLGRPPSVAERAECERFLADQATRLGDPKLLTAFTTGARPAVAPSNDAVQRARENLVHVLMNHHEFVTLR